MQEADGPVNMESVTEQIISNPFFLKLKTVIENNPWHDHESTYDHLLRTYKTAGEEIEGNFITDENAKKSFADFVNEDVDGVKRKDLMLITALVHDVGKLLYYKDDDKEQPLRHENAEGITKFPGHEYWSSTLVPDLLKDSGLSEKNIARIASVVRLHNTFSDDYLRGIDSLDIDAKVDDMKARAEGFEIEALFNIYCDEFVAEISKDSITKMVEVFNTPSLYNKREYFVK